MMEQAHVIVVGSVNADHVLRVDRLPQRGETVIGDELASFVGGKGANQAIAARRAGARVDFIGAVGDDAGGRAALAEFELENVGISHLLVRDEASTGTALIIVDRKGENQIGVAPGANASVERSQVREAMRALHPSSSTVVLLSFELRDEPLDAAAEEAIVAGARVILNPAPSRPLTPLMLRTKPILTPNRLEVEALLGPPITDQPLEAQIRELTTKTGAPVVVTLGSQGAIVGEPGGACVEMPAFPVSAIDTTGAGDAFAGVLAAAVAEGKAFRQAVRTAMAAAALSVTMAGAHTGYPGRAEIDHMLTGEPESVPLTGGSV
jgi:ribokinase